MPECKLCGEPVTAGIVIHKDCLTELLKKVRNDVCNYRCKWAMICEDKKKLTVRHCRLCEMSKLADLLKGGEGDA